MERSRVKVYVSDQGKGISPNDIAHIFDKFYRSDKARSKTDGFGLGLAIAKRIVTLHDGTLSVTSKVNKGTTFTLSFPTTV